MYSYFLYYLFSVFVSSLLLSAHLDHLYSIMYLNKNPLKINILKNRFPLISQSTLLKIRWHFLNVSDSCFTDYSFLIEMY